MSNSADDYFEFYCSSECSFSYRYFFYFYKDNLRIRFFVIYNENKNIDKECYTSQEFESSRDKASAESCCLLGHADVTTGRFLVLIDESDERFWLMILNREFVAVSEPFFRRRVFISCRTN